VYGLIRLARAGETFNQKMRQSLAIMGDVSDAMRKDMRTAALEAARNTRFAASEAAEAFFFLASAGLTAQQSVAALPQVAQFAQAGNFDLALATDLATDAQSALGMTVRDSAQNLKNLTRVTDVLVKANTLANASTQQFSEALTNKAGAALKIVGKDIEEGVAILAAWADQGLKSSDAGTAMNIVLRDLQTKALRAKQSNVQFYNAVFDANGEMRNMADIIGWLERRLGGMSDAQKKATMLQMGFTDKSMIFLQTLIGTSKKIREYEEQLRQAGGATREVADKQLTPLQKAWAKLGAAMTETGADILRTIGPALGSAMTALANWITDAWDTIKFGVNNAADLARLALVELAMRFLELVPQAEGPLEKLAQVFAGTFSGMRAFAASFFANVGGGFRELMQLAEAVGVAIHEGFRAISEGDIRNAASRMADTFIETFAKQQNVQAPNAFSEFHRAYTDAANKMQNKLARAGGLGAALETERDRLLDQIAKREAGSRRALEIATAAVGPMAGPPALPGMGEAGGKTLSGAAVKGSAEAWSRIMAAMGGGRKGPQEQIAKNTEKMERDFAEALQIWRAAEDRGGDAMEIPA
jgi:TP901 family phage tail tape measure protein